MHPQDENASGTDTLYHFGKALPLRQHPIIRFVRIVRTTPCTNLVRVGAVTGDNDHKGWNKLFEHYRLPPFIPEGSHTALSWGLAGPRTVIIVPSPPMCGSRACRAR
eukprot:4457214-Pyramimonas_sp.AAC.1